MVKNMRLIDVTYENVKNVLDNHGYYHDEYKRFYDMSKLFPTIEVPTWIPVSERLPEQDGRYLCIYRFNSNTNLTFTSVLDYYATDEVPHFQHMLNNDYARVTHWMPLPEAPKDGDT